MASEYEITEERFQQLDEDAPPMPKGLRPKEGVEYGCGELTCSDCYEPIPVNQECDDNK